MKIKIELDISNEIEQFNNAIDAWKEASGNRDTELKKAYVADRKDLREVLHYFQEGNLKKAYNKASYLDTIVRDVIPNSVWRILENNH